MTMSKMRAANQPHARFRMEAVQSIERSFIASLHIYAAARFARAFALRSNNTDEPGTLVFTPWFAGRFET
ncbi:MAG TPA: hypothetical protein VHP37_20180 [Burkholderiales bacterium]|nr:hypothetical protein [Burkholderiales bacterium]